MKKLILVLIVSVLLAGLVFGACGCNAAAASQGQQIQAQISAGTSNESTETQIQTRAEIRERIRSIAENLNISKEEIKEKVQVRLSNGRNAEIKVMPETASERALERLRLKVCSEENNCTIQLKEVGKNNETGLAYEVRAQKRYKVFGLFRARGVVNAEIDAETGEVLRERKPWWAFLAGEDTEEEAAE